MMPPKRHIPEDNVDSWLMSYADMITLLLCFFIIFVSVSEPKKEKLNEITDGLAGKFGSVATATPFQGVLRSLLGIVEAHRLFRDLSVSATDKGMELELAAGTFFKPASAELNPGTLPILNEALAAIKKLNLEECRISIEAHTSDVAIHTAQYPSNWELSSLRAATMAGFFIKQGVTPQHIKAVGYADSEPKVPNEDADGNAIVENREQNQRVVIKLERLP